MIVFVNDELEIQSVDEPKEGCTELKIIDDDPEYPNPFLGMSQAKIKCYKCVVTDGHVTMITPYRPSSDLKYIDEIGQDADNKTEALKILFGEEE